VDYRIIAREGFLELITSGVAEPTMWPDIQRALYAHPDFCQGGNLLSNHQDLDFTPMTDRDIKMIASWSIRRARQFGAGRIAFCVSGDLAFGLSRMYEALCAGAFVATTKVFRDRDQAAAWLHDHHDETETRHTA
jgi:hypothetical protein